MIRKITPMPTSRLARRGEFDHAAIKLESFSMQRRRAKAIAITQQQVLQTKLLIAAGMLLLPALLLLLISP
jgi:hypothetical protein